jgi:subtilisin family serine protease
MKETLDMPTSNPKKQFVLLPPRGMTTETGPANTELTTFLTSLEAVDRSGKRGVRPRATHKAPRRSTAARGKAIDMEILDSIRENGAKLIEMELDNVPHLRAARPGIRIVPVVYYQPAIVPPPQIMAPVRTARAAVTRLRLKIVSGGDKSPIVGADVVAFTDFELRQGAQGVTDANGEINLPLGALSKKLDRLYIFPKFGFWSFLKKNITVDSGKVIKLRPVDLAYNDSKRTIYGDAPDGAGAGLTVGVIDTGVAQHPDLVIAGGLNTVVGEDPSAFGDNGAGHGTHVAGIIAARGLAPNGVRGLAPGVTLRSYRVFGQNAGGASNFAIAKAIDRAVADGCDLINMSLGGGQPDPLTQEAISAARAKGVVIFAAAGNDERSPVSFPAAEPFALAVSALGRKGTFPADSIHTGAVAAPYGKPDKKYFIGAFSNIGLQIDLTGPGVGVISTFPGGYAALDGTSMACPAAAGIAAHLLSLPKNRAILDLSRDQTRWEEMIKVILNGASTLGFGQTFEGKGLITLK